MANEDADTPENLNDQFATQRSVEGTLYGVVDTINGPYAAGTGGKVYARTDDGWHTVIPAGPTTKRNTLLDLAVSDDRTRIWFAGSSGALGMYNVETGFKHDYTAPDERTSTWEAIAVAGPRGDEKLRIANGSGEVLTGTIDEKGCPDFGDAEKPGTGSTISALTFGPSIDAEAHGIGGFNDPDDETVDGSAPTNASAEATSAESSRNDSSDGSDEPDADDPDEPDEPDPDDPDEDETKSSESDPTDEHDADTATTAPDEETAGTCFAIDTSGNVFAEGEDDWYRIGIENAQVDFHDIHAHEDQLLVAGDDGVLYRYDRHCKNWTPIVVGEASLHALTSSDGDVVAAGASGTVYRRKPRLGWEPVETGLGDDLQGVAIGENVAAVGTGGVIVDDGADRNDDDTA